MGLHNKHQFNFFCSLFFLLLCFQVIGSTSSDNDQKKISLNKSFESAVKALQAQGEKVGLESSSSEKTLANPHASIKQALELVLPQFRQMPKAELRKFVKQKIAAGPSTKWLADMPRFINFLIELLRDESALPRMASIFEQKKKLMRVSLWVFSSFIFGFIVRRWIKKNIAKLGPRLIARFFVMIGLMSFRFGLFVYFFYSELSPTIYIISHII